MITKNTVDDNNGQANQHPNTSGHTRRNFLKLSAGSALSTLWALEGCGRTTEPEAEGPASDQMTQQMNSEPSPVAGSQLGQTLRMAFANIPFQFDPAIVTTNTASQIGFAIYEGLVWVDNELTVQPALAERWEAADDLLSWTFTLRQNVKFQHGTPFTARDVVYTFERLLDPEVGSPLLSVLNFVESVETIDDGTPTGAVRFTLKFANAELPLLCSAPQALIVAHDYDVKLLSRLPSGTGPFRVEKATPGRRFTFIRNNDYWAADTLSLQGMEHNYVPSFETRAAALKAGEFDLLPDISSEEAALLAIEDDIEIMESASGAYITVVMKVTEAPFDDLRVRQALKLCLDRPVIQKMLLGKSGEIGQDHPVPSINPFHADLPEQEQDIAQARQLLSDAGYPNGIKLDLITSPLDPGMVELPSLVQEMAAPAGFEISPTKVPADVYWDNYWLKVPFHIGSWNFRPGIDETFMIAHHSKSRWNESQWSSTELDGLLESARSESDLEQRKELYHRAQKLIMEEGAVIIPFFRPLFNAVHKRVTNFVPHPAGWINARAVKIMEPA